MKLLVLGKKGQVAHAMGNLNTDASIQCFGRPEVNILNAESLKKVLDRVQPDVVVNATAYTAVDEAESHEQDALDVNCNGVRTLGRLTQERGLPLIHLSTDYVFDGTKKSPYVETDPTAPINAYGRSKLAGEEALASENPHHIILRTSWVYSFTGKNFLKTMLRLTESHKELNVVYDQNGSPTYAPDIASAIFEISSQLISKEKSSYGIFHLTASGTTNWADFAREIFKVSKSMSGPFIEVHDRLASDWPTPAKRPQNSALNCKKVEKEYGIIMPQWQSGVARCLQALRPLDRPGLFH